MSHKNRGTACTAEGTLRYYPSPFTVTPNVGCKCEQSLTGRALRMRSIPTEVLTASSPGAAPECGVEGHVGALSSFQPPKEL